MGTVSLFPLNHQENRQVIEDGRDRRHDQDLQVGDLQELGDQERGGAERRRRQQRADARRRQHRPGGGLSAGQDNPRTPELPTF